MERKAFIGKVTALCACAVALPLFAATNITGDVALDANADWRGLGTVTVEAGATVSIRLGELRASSGGQLIAWASTPENVTFKPAEGERNY